MTRIASAVLFAAVCLFAAGCGESAPDVVPASGTVTLNGKPLPKVQVKFIPQADVGAEFIATGVTDDQGRYTLTCNGEPGACEGENKVIIAEQEPPEELLSETKQKELAAYRRTLKNRPVPKAYGNLADTPLKKDVKAGQPTYDFDLKR